MSTEDFIQQLKECILSDLQRSIQSEIDRLYKARISIATLSTEEAAEYIGVSKECLYTMVREKQIPHMHIGSAFSKKPNLRFRLSTLDSWMEEREAKSVEAKECRLRA